MRALLPKEITKAIENAFFDASALVVPVSEARANPRKFYVSTREASFPVWIYIWTLTHGGGAARPTDEYRIQLTSVTSPLPENPDGPTLLLGYEPDIKCFVGFDLRKHRLFSTGSPSIQVNVNILREAVRDGFAFARKGNDEIAVGFRPDNMIAYCLNSENLHESGADTVISKLLSKVGRLETVTTDEMSELSHERKRLVTKVSRLARDSDFRRKVTSAYDGKCCITGLQLRLIDAAHILPVGATGSTDGVQNGLCLSPTYHRAYDRSLIYLTEDRRMLINQEKKDDLVRLGLSGGSGEFEAPLGKEIFLPSDKNQWPQVKFIRAANEFREKNLH